MNRLYFVYVAFIFCLLCSFAAAQASDYQLTFNNNGIDDYTLQTGASTQIYPFDLPANDPTMNLILGKRYEIAVVNFAIHPFQIIAKGATAVSDVVVLSMGATAGSLEGDAGVAFTDDSAGTIMFTVTQTLLDAMEQGVLTPGYRCGVHTTMMRGDFVPVIPITLPQGLAISLEPIANGLISPVGLTNAGDGSGRLFVVDQIGTIRIIDNGVLLATPFLDISSDLVTLDPVFDERGLLGLAFHPDYATNGRFFVFYSTDTTDINMNCTSRIAEYSVSGDPDIADASSEQILLEFDKPQFNHNGGHLAFGPDGYLYISTGDGGNANDEGDGHNATTGNGQDINTLLGKILRLDVSTPGSYAIPADNPFVGIDGADEIFSYGFRNPYSFSFDSVGRLFVADVGQNMYEEINDVKIGENFGWRLKEGLHCFNPQIDCNPGALPLVDPIAEYDHFLGIAVVGGYNYNGTQFPELVGKYIFGDWSLPGFGGDGRMFYLDETDTDVWEMSEFITNGGPSSGFGTYITAFGEGEDGEVYVVSKLALGPDAATTTGAVHRIVKDVPPTNIANWKFY